jgi:hypothetical protein
LLQENSGGGYQSSANFAGRGRGNFCGRGSSRGGRSGRGNNGGRGNRAPRRRIKDKEGPATN